MYVYTYLCMYMPFLFIPHLFCTVAHTHLRHIASWRHFNFSENRCWYFGPFRAHHSAFYAYLPISTHGWCVRLCPTATTLHWFTHCTSLDTCAVAVVLHRSAQSSVDQPSLWQHCANVIFSFCIDRNSIECLLPCLPLVTIAVVVIIFRSFYFK